MSDTKKGIWENRFPLSFYFRIADQFVKRAKVYRDEENINDLYNTLNRYSSLLLETIPQHPNYSTYSTKEKLRHKKLLEEFLKEMETLKLCLGRKVNEITGQVKFHGLVKKKSHRPDVSTNCVPDFRSGSVRTCVAAENIGLVSVFTTDSRTGGLQYDTPCSMSSTTAENCNVSVHVVVQSSPSPVLSYIENAPPAAHVSQINVSDSRNGNLKYSTEESSASKAFHDIHISGRLMEDFLELARDNTDKNLETCGILGAFLKNGTFYVTTLIIPKQESSSSTCQALNEEEIHAIQDEQSLFPVGWIHTHPSQSCFMSSIDLHTQYSYQVMLPEAFAIVMAPTDDTRRYGIFRLTDPAGTTVLKECQEKGFHPHQEPPDRSPIYEDCSNVYTNSNLRFEIIDLR